MRSLNMAYPFGTSASPDSRADLVEYALHPSFLPLTRLYPISYYNPSFTNTRDSLRNTMASKSNSSSSPPINCKLLLIGNSSVGKSSLLLRFSDEQWLPEDESSATIGVDFRVSGLSIKVTRLDLFMRSLFWSVL